MTAYYNENDPKAAAWLRELIRANLIAPGDVDERSIADVCPGDLGGYAQHHFFAGIGGWSCALRLAGWSDSRPVWTGSCPCQPFSAAGKGGGAADSRHLWPDFWWLIAQRKPSVVFGEQVASGAGREWLAGVRADMETLGYAVGAADLCAAGVGSPHIRQRLYWVADSKQTRTEVHPKARIAINGYETASRPGPEWERSAWSDCAIWNMPDGRRRCEPGSFPLVDGVSERLDAIAGYGNAIVPPLAAEFIRAYA